jgi:hypothetical protein
LRFPKLPWVDNDPVDFPLFFFIVVAKHCEKHKAKDSAVLTNLDVLYAVHFTFTTQITPEKWHSLGEGSRDRSAVLRRYIKRKRSGRNGCCSISMAATPGVVVARNRPCLSI